jgi:hypothetical protein
MFIVLSVIPVLIGPIKPPHGYYLRAAGTWAVIGLLWGIAVWFANEQLYKKYDEKAKAAP